MGRLYVVMILAVSLAATLFLGNCDCGGGLFSQDEQGDDDCYRAALLLPDECAESCANFFTCLSGNVPDRPELPQTLEECRTMCEDGDFLGNVFCSECVFTCWLGASVCDDAIACSWECLDTTCRQGPDDDTMDDDSDVNGC